MTYLGKLHSKFLRDLLEASKLFSHNVVSIVPSIIFLTTFFALLYIQFHKHTNSLAGWKTRVCKNVVFHWTYFYTSRVWFMFVKVCKWVTHYSDKAIEKNSSADEIYYNKIITHFCIFIFALTISVIPSLILYVRYLNRRQMPNFLLWVAEDPWVRSEIGTSGHYLERPPRAEFFSPYKRTASYRSGRSSSVDTNVYLEKQYSFLRPCKSAVSVKKSSEDIAD